MSSAHRTSKGTISTCLLLVCFTSALYAESAVLLCDHNLEDYLEMVTWTEYSLSHPPNVDSCFALAEDANYLWVGTSAGAVRWNLQENRCRLFKADDEWSMKYAEKLPLKNNENGSWRENKRPYVDKWLTNAVENIIVLSPGHVWVDTFRGALIIHGNRKVVYPSIEHALAALYHSDLRPTLGKIVATDRKGCLWLLKKKKETTDDFELFCYDGTAWKKDKLAGIVKPEYGIEDILRDGKGNLWACNARGIYQYGEKRWESVLKEGYYKMRLGAGGTLWAFARGTLAKFAGDTWKVFRAEGRYKDFSPLHTSEQDVVLQTPDGKLWFAASFGQASTLGFMCFDGKGLSQASFYPVAAMSNDAGQTYAASGDRLYFYEEGKWNKLPMLPYQTFKLVSLWGVKGAGIIEDILVAEDGTVYVATNKEGLLRCCNGSWDKMSCKKSKQEVECIDQDAADMIAEMAGGIQSLLLDLSATSQVNVETLYNAYIEGDSNHLIKASNEQLAEDIVSGENCSSPISYYRLLTRNKRLAKVSLEKRMEAMCASDYGEGWINKLEIASYGPPVTECLLKIAKTGTPEQRAVAIDTLGVMRNPGAVRKLLDTLGDVKKLNRLSYLCLARAAIMAGNPKGIELLIEAATTGGSLQQICQDELDRVTRGYDDLPGDWSREKWNVWWEKHSSSWDPKTAYTTALPTAMATMRQKMYEAVAEKIEKRN